jgi:hypothetical protein
MHTYENNTTKAAASVGLSCERSCSGAPNEAHLWEETEIQTDVLEETPLMLLRDGEVSMPFAEPGDAEDDTDRSVAKAKRQKQIRASE